jgi:hypothetical protein
VRTFFILLTVLCVSCSTLQTVEPADPVTAAADQEKPLETDEIVLSSSEPEMFLDARYGVIVFNSAFMMREPAWVVILKRALVEDDPEVQEQLLKLAVNMHKYRRIQDISNIRIIDDEIRQLEPARTTRTLD